MAEVIFDSNIWIALLNTNDSQHKKAVELMGKQESTDYTFIVTNYLDIECISVLTKRAGIEMAQKWIEMRKESPLIQMLHINEVEHEEIIDLLEKLQDSRLSFTDISLISLAEQGYSILTFDEQLQNTLKKLKLPSVM